MQEIQHKKITVVACQTHPHLHKKKQNIAKFDQTISRLNIEDQIDLVVFPQMAFTGYNFKNHQDASPVAVCYGQGQQFDYARTISRKLNAYVLFGYVEKCQEKEEDVLYNSAAMCNREGQFVFNTRKTHLYYADQLWAKEGPGFKTVQIKNLKGQTFNCGVGICMDINAKGFTSGKHEFADFIKEKDCELIIFPTNWVDHDKDSTGSSVQIFNYWLQRLEPILKPKSNKMRYFIAADRVGQEYSFHDKENINFLGSSAVLSLNPNKLMCQNLNKTEQNYIKTELALPKI